MKVILKHHKILVFVKSLAFFKEGVEMCLLYVKLFYHKDVFLCMSGGDLGKFKGFKLRNFKSIFS